MLAANIDLQTVSCEHSLIGCYIHKPALKAVNGNIIQFLLFLLP